MMWVYCRVSTKKQSLQRQIDNIKAVFPEIPDNRYFSDKFTGNTVDRPMWKKLYKKLRSGDTVIFDSVSRMSRNAAEGSELYEDLYSKGIDIIFLNEPTCNTSNYREAQSQSIPMTGNEVADIYIEATNKVLMILAKKQIKLAFDQAEAERNDICKRVKDGMRSKKEAAARNGVLLEYGTKQGTKIITSKSIEAKEKIKKYSKTFEGNLSDIDCIKLVGVSKNTYYKYKSELKSELENSV